MKKTLKILLILLAAVSLAAGALALAIHTGPGRALRQAERFVAEHAQELEPLLDAAAPIPVYPEVVACNSWDAAHPMKEFILKPRLGLSYSGCYYSPDDVPLSFQNAVPHLTHEGEGRWSWQRGNNHGTTVRLRKGWYSFQAWI